MLRAGKAKSERQLKAAAPKKSGKSAGVLGGGLGGRGATYIQVVSWCYPAALLLEVRSASPAVCLILEENHTLAPPAPGDSDAESDNSDRVPVPSFQNSFSQAIEAAFLKLDKPSTPDLLMGKKKEAALLGSLSEPQGKGFENGSVW